MHIEKIITAIMIAGLALSMNACKVDNDPIPVNPAQVGNLPINKLYESLKGQAQNFTVTAGVSQTITGAKGTMITFNPQSFKDNSGAIITSGNIRIELTEALTPGQMIMNRVSTVTDANNLLQSGGCINIVATLNQQPVLAGNYKISFKQPAANAQPMTLFNGIVSTGQNTGAVIWSNDTSNTVSGTTNINNTQGPDSVGGFSYYVFDSCTDFNWVNCDYFYSSPDPKTDINVVMPDGTYNDSTTSVMIVFPTLNMVAPMHHYDATTHTFNFGVSNYFLPVGINIKVVVMGVKNDVYFFELKPNITVTNGLTINAVPANTTLSNIQTTLSGL